MPSIRVWRDEQDDDDEFPPGRTLDSCFTQAGGFLHEMMHFEDMFIIDAVENGQYAYGFELCRDLVPGLKLSNADNFRLIATASYLDQIDWSSGAKPAEEDDELSWESAVVSEDL